VKQAPTEPLILGFDTSANHCAAALLRGEEVLAQRHEDMSKGQAESLFPLLESVLAEGGIGWGDLSAIGVGVGPGNFTGIRISVAAARGLGFSLGIPVVGVSTLEAQAIGLARPVLSLVDGRRGTCFAQLHEGSGASHAAQMIECADVPRHLHRSDLTCVGGEAEAVARDLSVQSAQQRHPIAVAIALLALERRDSVTNPPAPLYVRPADAAPARDAPPTILP